MVVDIHNRYETKDGRRVRIYATDGSEDHPIHGAVEEIEGWRPVSWESDGSYFWEQLKEYDLVEITETYRLAPDSAGPCWKSTI